MLGGHPGGVSHPVGQLRLSWFTRFCVWLGRVAGAVSRRAGRGQGGTLPGRVVLRLRPQALAELAVGRQVVMVSGTNGKSTTTRLLAAALASQGPLVTNLGGANLMSGLVTALLPPAPAAVLAVLEVDELALPAALESTDAGVVVLLNLSRDQLDRVHEVGSHVGRWSRALQSAAGVQVVANADDPLVTLAVLSADPDGRRTTWVGVGSPWRQDFPLCPRCGAAWDGRAEAWLCSQCGLGRPRTQWCLLDGDQVQVPGGRRYHLELALPGRASAANAVMAVVTAAVLGVAVDVSLEQMRQVQDVDGRYLVVEVQGRPVRLLLAKNPAGWLEILDQTAAGQDALLLGVNARTADGADPSWLWDVPFETLAGRTVVVFGERAADLSARLHYAEVPHLLARTVSEALTLVPERAVVVAANYTAFTATRSVLRDAS